MEQFLTVALAFPSIVYTVMLVVSLLYWIFVMVGAAHINLLGDGAADAAIDGMADGAIEGATKGALEGVADHLDGHLDGHADALGDGVAGGGTTGIMAALKLRSAPATVVLSVTIFFSWMLALVGQQVITAMMPAGGGTMLTLAKVGLFVLAPLIALLPTSIVIRPLAKVFNPPDAVMHESLVGKLCTIRTGTVNDRFGEATLEDGGPGMVVRVRIDTGQTLGRGDQALIVGYDAEREEFQIAPMEDDEEREEKKKKKLAAATARKGGGP